jgi:AhpD family alkylhydroperoxidase
MEARLNFYSNPLAAKFAKHINSAGAVVTQSSLPAAAQELVKIRASQINGCALCTDMHTKDAAHAGETSLRLNLVAAWRDATVFTQAERAALELTEEGTRIADASAGVSEDAFGERRHALRRGPARRAGGPDRPDQHIQPDERHDPAARGRLRARPVGLALIGPESGRPNTRSTPSLMPRTAWRGRMCHGTGRTLMPDQVDMEELT